MREEQRSKVAAFSVASSISTKTTRKNKQSLRSFRPFSDLHHHHYYQHHQHHHPSLTTFPSCFTSSSCGTASQLSLSPSSFSSLLTAADDVITSTTSGGSSTSFEPVVDVPALLSTLLVLVGALLLRLRQNAIAQAAEDRIAALEKLREAKTKELSLDISSEDAQLAVVTYEKALEKEEQMRTLIPGVRLKAPNNPQRSKEDQEAVVQFLDANANATMYVTEIINSDTSSQTTEEEDVAGDSNNIGPAFGFGVLLLLILSPQFLAMFLSESDTKEILDILAGS